MEEDAGLFLGDIVGRAARNAVIAQLADLRQDLAADFAVVNCENAAGGFGITPAICDDLFAAGADVLTTGNHVWDKREIFDYIAAEPGYCARSTWPRLARQRCVCDYQRSWPATHRRQCDDKFVHGSK